MRRPFPAFLLAALALLCACGLFPTKIEAIKADPARYEDRRVTVRGKVEGVTKLPFLDQGFYKVDDGTGSIAVMTRGGLPKEGERVTVRGKVRSALRIGGKSFGLVLVPEER